MDHLHISLLGVRIDALTQREALERTADLIQAGGFHHIVTPGPEFLLEAHDHPRFQKILQRADLALPDGMGLKVGALLTGQHLPERVPGADFVEALLADAAIHDWTVFLFGGAPGVGERAARQLISKYPSLRIVGIESGGRGPWVTLHDQRVLERIHLAKPTLLLVALGAPKQELWIDRHRTALHDVRVAIGVGRTFDYLSGQVSRPPRFLRRLGLEWVGTWLQAGRLHQPQLRRQRVANATWHFLRHVIFHGRS